MSEIILTAYDGAILGPIARLLGLIMNAIYSFMINVLGVGNISVAIIVFTIVFYTFMLPITYKQQKYSKLTQKMSPELQKVQKKYHGKKDQLSIQRMQEETGAIYEKYGVSPSGSCVYMLINFPVILALYRVFQNIPAYVGSVKDQFSDLVDAIMATGGYQKIMTDIVEEVRLTTVSGFFRKRYIGYFQLYCRYVVWDEFSRMGFVKRKIFRIVGFDCNDAE